MIYNIGDRVRITNKKSFYYNWVGTVNKIINKSHLYVCFDSGNHSWFDGNHDVELLYRCCEMEADKMEIGNSVRIKNKNSYHYDNVGTIIDSDRLCRRHVYFGTQNRYSSWFDIDELELIEKKENNMSSLPRSSGRYPWGDSNNIPKVKKVIFNCPATIVLFEDGTKTVVKMDENDPVWDPEHGLAMALVKRVYGTNKSHSNYYDIFKKWIPEDDLINGCIEDDKKAVATFQEFCQNVKDAGIKEVTAETDTGELLKPKKTKEEIRDEIVDATMNGAPKKKLAELVQESRDILDCHRKGFISEFVDKWEATMFPKEFIEFCRKNNLYFYIVDSKFGGLKKCNPYEECWQKVNSYIRRNLIEYANKTVEKGPNKNKVFKAIDISKCIFSRLPKELRNGKGILKNESFWDSSIEKKDGNFDK